jgi:arsenate reductase
MIKVYGIANCDTVKKVLNWMKDHQLAYEFHDYKKQGITATKLNKWCGHFGWETLVNKNGTTWKELSESEKNAVVDQHSAVNLMMEKTSIIKRPIIEAGRKYLIRFDEKLYAETLLKK